VFDILASIKCNNGDENDYIPFLVSVKSRRGKADVTNELKRMFNLANKCSSKGALCLVVLLDLHQQGNYSEIIDHLLDKSNVEANLKKSIVCKVLVIQGKDEFGIDKLVQNTRVGDSKECEVYSSHWMIPSLSDGFWAQSPPTRYAGDAWNFAKDQISYLLQQRAAKTTKTKMSPAQLTKSATVQTHVPTKPKHKPKKQKKANIPTKQKQTKVPTKAKQKMQKNKNRRPASSRNGT
jgi:hypothetical protein